MPIIHRRKGLCPAGAGPACPQLRLPQRERLFRTAAQQEKTNLEGEKHEQDLYIRRPAGGPHAPAGTDPFEQLYGLEARLLAKLEYLNPTGSVKDRAAKAMLDDAEARGVLKPGMAIIEPTSGNTGIGLAMVAAARGYRAIIVMPDTMSRERRRLDAETYGAELVLTEGAKGMKGAIERAGELAGQIQGSFIPGQFENPANPAAHRAATGPEIWQDTDGVVDIFVAGVGTGGTISGVGQYLKQQNPAVRVVAVEPAASPVPRVGKGGATAFRASAPVFVPAALDRTVCDEVLPVADEDAFALARRWAAGKAYWWEFLPARRCGPPSSLPGDRKKGQDHRCAAARHRRPVSFHRPVPGMSRQGACGI